MDLYHISEVARPERDPPQLFNSSDNDDGDTPLQLRWNMLWLLTVIVATGASNLLVCVAVCRERALQNMANYFLMSLAIADFLVSVTVMPVAMTVLIFGECKNISRSNFHCCCLKICFFANLLLHEVFSLFLQYRLRGYFIRPVMLRTL